MKRGFEEFNIESNLIICFPRINTEESCIELLQEYEKFKNDFIAIGLVNVEPNNPTSKFENLYSMAKAMGFRLTAHAGEVGGPEYIKEAIDILGCDRIDHGFTAQFDKELMEKIAKQKIPLTLCPLSNKQIGVCSDLKTYPIRLFNDARIVITINSDDPAFFGLYC
jgi:adenosine deaminase